MNTQHTPGPWIADRSAVFNDDRHFICQTDCGFNSPETGDPHANARLIAAAPELLAALQRAEERLRAANSERTEAQGHFMISDIQSAIAKAKGQA